MYSNKFLLINLMKLYKKIEIKLNSSVSRSALLDLINDCNIGVGVSVVCIYKLIDSVVGYPEQEGNIIYIGESKRLSESTAKRFSQHISTRPNKGADSGTIYSLSRYYWLDKKISLEIFLVDEKNKEDGKIIEKKLLFAHVKKFGALPICQGATGQNYSTSSIAIHGLSNCLLGII